MPEEKKAPKRPHNLILENRKHLTLSGVSDIDSFDEQTIVVFTDMGELTIKGYQLHINQLSVETGDLDVEGEIYSLTYVDETKREGGFFAKLFK